MVGTITTRKVATDTGVVIFNSSSVRIVIVTSAIVVIVPVPLKKK
jgi:hypothetical protein